MVQQRCISRLLSVWETELQYISANHPVLVDIIVQDFEQESFEGN